MEITRIIKTIRNKSDNNNDSNNNNKTNNDRIGNNNGVTTISPLLWHQQLNKWSFNDVKLISCPR